MVPTLQEAREFAAQAGIGVLDVLLLVVMFADLDHAALDD